MLAWIALLGCNMAPASDDAPTADDSSGSWEGDADTDADADGDSDADSDSDTDTDSAADSATDTAEPEVCDGALPEVLRLTMSADDSNSQASPVLFRGQIQDGQTFINDAKAWEFLNYYDFHYPPADTGLGLQVGAAAQADTVELVAAVVAPRETAAGRRPLNLVFAVDVSGSMAGRGIQMVKAAIEAMATQLRAGDRVSLVTWATSTNTLLSGHEVTGADDPALLAALDGLEVGSSTNLSMGLSTGYNLAREHQSAGFTSRVVLLSDGGANTGETDEELIGARAAGREDEAIYLIGVGVGAPGSYDTRLMDTVTDLGRGAHVFIDTSDEAARQFGDAERFIENLMVAATDVTLQMDLPAGWVIERFSGEQISTNPKEVRPQNLAPNDQMLYHLTLRNCGGEADPAFTFEARWADLEGAVHTTNLAGPLSTLALTEPAQVVKAVALVDTADALDLVWKLNPDERAAALLEAKASVDAALLVAIGDEDLAEVGALLEAYAAMF